MEGVRLALRRRAPAAWFRRHGALRRLGTPSALWHSDARWLLGVRFALKTRASLFAHSGAGLVVRPRGVPYQGRREVLTCNDTQDRPHDEANPRDHAWHGQRGSLGRRQAPARRARPGQSDVWCVGRVQRRGDPREPPGPGGGLPPRLRLRFSARLRLPALPPRVRDRPGLQADRPLHDLLRR